MAGSFASPFTLIRHADDPKNQHGDLIKKFLVQATAFNYAMCSVEVDLWRDSKRFHWMTFVLHLLDKDFNPKCFVFCAGLTADKSAREQAQRILHVCNRYGIDVSHLLWVIGVDNTVRAYKVPERMQCLLCGAHVIASGAGAVVLQYLADATGG